jgi:hypothetical protein
MIQTDREAIARIIDPANWIERDRYMQRAGEWSARGRADDDALVGGYRLHADDLVVDSLIKADEIISLLTRTEATTGARDEEKRRLLQTTVYPILRAWDFSDLGSRLVAHIGVGSMFSDILVAEFNAMADDITDAILAALAQPAQDEGGVIQADREAAASLALKVSGWGARAEADAMRMGRADHCNAIQAFAAHRRAFSRERGE